MEDIVKRNEERNKQFETELENLLLSELPLAGLYKRHKLTQLILLLHIKYCTKLIDDLRVHTKDIIRDEFMGRKE